MPTEIKHPELDRLLLDAKKSESGLIQLANTYAHSVADNWELARQYHEKILELCEEYSEGENTAAGISQLISALFYYYTTQFHLVGDVARKAIDILSKTDLTDLLGTAYMILGTNMRSLGRFDEAVELLGKASRIIDPKGDFRIYFSFAHYQLAEIFVQLQDFELAESNYLLAKEVAESHTDKTAYFRTTNGLGNLYLAIGDYENALKYLEHSLNISQREIQNARAYCDLAIYHLKTNDAEKSLEYANKSYDIRKELGYEDAASTSLIHKGNALLALERYDEAKQCCGDALIIIEQFKSNSKKVLALGLLAKIEEHSQNWEQAYRLNQEHQILKDTLSNQQMRNIYKMKNKMIEEQKNQIEEAHKEITDSIAYAKRIQKAILPSNSALKKSMPEHFVLYEPKDVVAGDFYWLEEGVDTIFFAAADCTGHGVPGAMVSVVCHNALNRSVREFGLNVPGKILDKTRDIVIEEFKKSEEEVKDGMDICLCALRGNTLQFSGAHNPLWLVRDGQLMEYKGDKQPVGKFSHATPFSTQIIQLEKGDAFYILTDGYVDQFGGEKGKKFKASNLKELVLSIHKEPMNHQHEILLKKFGEWKGNLEQVDDVCVIGVRV